MNRLSWHKVAPHLVNVAAGKTQADLVIYNCCWVNVLTRELITGIDVAISRGRIALIAEDASYCSGPDTYNLDARGRYLVPGLADGHLHIESSMCTITEYVRAVLPHGTTAIFIDPHEIANVFGLDGVRMMADEAASMPINVFVQVPSCVPSAPGLETTRGQITSKDVSEALTWPNVIGLGEMMNSSGLANNDPQMHAEVRATMQARKIVGGHYAGLDLGRDFHSYLAAGPADDHENTSETGAIERARRGLRPMLRLGSAWLDVASQITAITKKHLDPRQFILCTDDVHAATLINEGHMDRVLRHTVDEGCDPLIALQLMTINTAQHFGVDRDLGCIAPGRYADLILTNSLSEFSADVVIVNGQIAAKNGNLLLEIKPWIHEDRFHQSVNIALPITKKDFVAVTDSDTDTVEVNVIGVIENQTQTQHLSAFLQVIDNEIKPDLLNDVLPLALLERHNGSGKIVNGFVKGFGFKGSSAVASTIAHDSHHMLVTGTSTRAMSLAANILSDVGGGIVVVRDGKVRALIKLKIGGLMSNQRAERVAKESETVMDAIRDCGCRLNNGFMQLSLLSLAVIPELRISDMGIVKVSKRSHIPLIK